MTNPITANTENLLDFCIDLNLATKSNGLSRQTNLYALQVSLNSFLQYIEKHTEVKEFFSINKTEFFQASQDFSFLIHYSNLSKKDTIKSALFELIDYALGNQSKRSLKGEKLKDKNDADNFFHAFILKYVSQPELSYDTTKSLINTKESHLLYCSIDLDVMSQLSNKSNQSFAYSLSRFCDYFKQYLRQHKEDKELLSIIYCNYAYRSYNKVSLSTNYSDLSKKDIIESILEQVVNYASQQDNDSNLNGSVLTRESSEHVFENLLMPYVLELTLKNNSEHAPKKHKI